jgi:hypothetical protein
MRIDDHQDSSRRLERLEGLDTDLKEQKLSFAVMVVVHQFKSILAHPRPLDSGRFDSAFLPRGKPPGILWARVAIAIGALMVWRACQV